MMLDDPEIVLDESQSTLGKQKVVMAPFFEPSTLPTQRCWLYTVDDSFLQPDFCLVPDLFCIGQCVYITVHFMPPIYVKLILHLATHNLLIHIPETPFVIDKKISSIPR